MNESDSERIASFLESFELKPAKEIAKADLVVFNTCGVRQSAENRTYGQVHNLRKQEKVNRKQKKIKIVITGCLAHRKDVQKKLKEKVDFYFSIRDFWKFENWIIENYLEIGNWKLEILAQKTQTKKESSYLSIKPKYLNSDQTFVPIMTGCNNFCTYCVVPYARGREWSRPVKDIFEEISTLAKKGCKEITLLGQNVNSYEFKIKSQRSIRQLANKTATKNSKMANILENLDIENLKLGIDCKLKIGNWKLKCQSEKNKIITFPILLALLAESYPQIFWHFLTSNPKDFSDELIEVIAKHPNISREIHLPIQSGSNRILQKMNRPYTRAHYLKLIKKTRKKIPGAKFSTDVIVGFPGETEKDFQKTAEVFKKVGFFEAYVNKYSPRPETSAFKLKDDVAWEEKKTRERELRKLISAK
jgi:tRNA-2-methylthio-N6-dimethylallyladenosine synthase